MAVMQPARHLTASEIYFEDCWKPGNAALCSWPATCRAPIEQVLRLDVWRV